MAWRAPSPHQGYGGAAPLEFRRVMGFFSGVSASAINGLKYPFRRLASLIRGLQASMGRTAWLSRGARSFQGAVYRLLCGHCCLHCTRFKWLAALILSKSIKQTQMGQGLEGSRRAHPRIGTGIHRLVQKPEVLPQLCLSGERAASTCNWRTPKLAERAGTVC